MTTTTTGGGAASTHFVCTVAEFMAATPRERLLYVRRQIHLTPERWDQDAWAKNGSIDWDEVRDDNPHRITPECGARMCIAGWTVVLAGDLWVDTECVRVDGGDEMYVDERAADLLGLDNETAHAMFYGFHGTGYDEEDLAELDDIIERYTT